MNTKKEYLTVIWGGKQNKTSNLITGKFYVSLMSVGDACNPIIRAEIDERQFEIS